MSRNKKTRRVGRTVRIVNDLTGEVETFTHVLVSDVAIASWLADRPICRREGYPDRPPDVDTPNFRRWLPRPDDGPVGSVNGDPKSTAGRDRLVADFANLIETWRCPVPGGDLQGAIEVVDGAIRVRVRHNRPFVGTVHEAECLLTSVVDARQWLQRAFESDDADPDDVKILSRDALGAELADLLRAG